jgi:hypothetical protein
MNAQMDKRGQDNAKTLEKTYSKEIKKKMQRNWVKNKGGCGG